MSGRSKRVPNTVPKAGLRAFLEARRDAAQLSLDRTASSDLAMSRFLGERDAYENMLDALDAGAFERTEKEGTSNE